MDNPTEKAAEAPAEGEQELEYVESTITDKDGRTYVRKDVKIDDEESAKLMNFLGKIQKEVGKDASLPDFLND